MRKSKSSLVVVTGVPFHGPMPAVESTASAGKEITSLTQSHAQIAAGDEKALRLSRELRTAGDL
jgi:hypothetical protein